MPSHSPPRIPSLCENCLYNRPAKSCARTRNPCTPCHGVSFPIPSSKSLARYHPGRICAPLHSRNRSLHQECHLGCITTTQIPTPIQRLPDSHPLDHPPNRSHLLSHRWNCRLSQRRLASRCRANLRLENPRRFHRLHWLGSHSANSFPILSPRSPARPISKEPASLAHPHHWPRVLFSPPARYLDCPRHRHRRANLDSHLLPLPPFAATRSVPRRTWHRILLRHLRPRPRPGMAIGLLCIRPSVIGPSQTRHRTFRNL